MRHLTQFLAFWVFNVWLWFAMISNPEAYRQWRADGAQWYICMELTPSGLVPSGQCQDAPPTYDPEFQ